MRFDLSQGFPLLTTKKVHLKSIIYELLWFISGSTNIHYLTEHGVKIWNEWADENGELGPVYGKQWRDFETADGRHIDQLKNAVDMIKHNPDSRRIIVCAWNPGDIERMALPPCHTLFQFYVANGKLSCQLYQRSCDMFLGVPFNIASYALLTLMMALGMTALAEESKDQLARIQEKGEIVIATEGTWAPWTYTDENGNLVGFDVEIATAIAEKLGVKATFVTVEWDGILAGIDSGRYDIAANGIDVTEQRSEKYNFSTPYAFNRTALVVRGDNEDIKSFEDLKGKKTTNSIASTYMILAEEFGAEVVGVDTLDQTIMQVLTGRADATLNSEVSIADYMQKRPDANIKIVALTEEANLVAIPTRKTDDSASLLEAINQAIAELREEGKLSEISMKYFGRDITAETVGEAAE